MRQIGRLAGVSVSCARCELDRRRDRRYRQWGRRHDGDHETLTLTTAEHPSRLGIRVRAIDGQLANYFDVERGLLVQHVERRRADVDSRHASRRRTVAVRSRTSQTVIATPAANRAVPTRRPPNNH